MTAYIRKWAMIANDIIIDIVESAEIPYYPPLEDETEIEAVEIPEGTETKIGYLYKDNTFSEPPEPVIPRTEPKVLSETDEAILNTNLNVEYLIALQELGL